MRNRDGSLVYLSQGIHLLHVLPVAATKYSRPSLQHLDVIKPYPSSINVNADLLEYELVSLCDDLSVLAGRIIDQVVAPPDEVDV